MHPLQNDVCILAVRMDQSEFADKWQMLTVWSVN